MATDAKSRAIPSAGPDMKHLLDQDVVIAGDTAKGPTGAQAIEPTHSPRTPHQTSDLPAALLTASAVTRPVCPVNVRTEVAVTRSQRCNVPSCPPVSTQRSSGLRHTAVTCRCCPLNTRRQSPVARSHSRNV